MDCLRHATPPNRTAACTCTAPLADTGKTETDKELGLLEGELRSEAKHWTRRSKELDGGSPIDQSLALKAADVALKLHRAYKEILLARKEREHDRWLVEENRKLQGGGGN